QHHAEVLRVTAAPLTDGFELFLQPLAISLDEKAQTPKRVIFQAGRAADRYGAQQRPAELGKRASLARQFSEPGDDRGFRRKAKLVANAVHAPPSSTNRTAPRSGNSGLFSTRMISSAATR